jgi:CRISPR-associated protein Csd1
VDKDGKKEKRRCISAPGADDIITAVFGKNTGESYAKLKKQARERILHYIFCGEPISRDWVKSAVHRASSPFSYTIKDGGWDKSAWDNTVAVACALTRVYYNEKGEKLTLESVTEYVDRSSLYGRLLAIADRLESHARYLQMGKNDTEKRPTNAVRYMQRFANKPFATWTLLYSSLIDPYRQRLNGAGGYQKQIEEIILQFKPGEYESDTPLDGRYLMGYSLQRRELTRKKDDNKTEVNENADQKN